MLYRLKTGRHYRIEGEKKDGTPDRVMYRPDDLINLSRKEAERFGDRVVPHAPHVDDEVTDQEVLAAADAAAAPAGAETPEASEAPATPETPPEPEEVVDSFGVADMTVVDVEELVTAIDTAADLRAIYAAEEANRQRIGVFNAVRHRLAALNDEEEGEDGGDDDSGEG